jgi:hypothetical protein
MDLGQLGFVGLVGFDIAGDHQRVVPVAELVDVSAELCDPARHDLLVDLVVFEVERGVPWRPAAR